jgi:cystathionine beta-lyase/cystathionine gamma-synthase
MDLDPSTRAAHAGLFSEHGEPSSPAIYLASFYASEGDPAQIDYAYGRHGNPTWEALEGALGALEEANARVFASGQAATFALLMALTHDRQRVLLPLDGYYGTRKLCALLAPRGIESVALDLQDLGRVERELAAGPSVLWAETPTNPFLRVQDLTELSRLARAADAPLVVDNTTATAALQRPLEFGARAVVTSLTKSASGHSDVLLGAVTTRDTNLLERVQEWRANAGAIAGPFEAWAALRGLRTLPLRIGRQSESALAIARWLERHPRVRRVHYPGTGVATLEVARKQMHGGFGPLLSFELDGDQAAADALVASSQLIRRGTSFGGLETSWERRARWASETAPESLIRLSVGIEAADDLIRDLEQALASR